MASSKQKLIEDLFVQLHEHEADPGPPAQPVPPLSKRQLDLTAALSHVFPDAFVGGIELLEQKRCRIYRADQSEEADRFRSIEIRLADAEIVNLQLWSCTCDSQIRSLEDRLLKDEIEPWGSACQHLLAHYMADENYAFLPRIPIEVKARKELTSLMVPLLSSIGG